HAQFAGRWVLRTSWRIRRFASLARTLPLSRSVRPWRNAFRVHDLAWCEICILNCYAIWSRSSAEIVGFTCAGVISQFYPRVTCQAHPSQTWKVGKLDTSRMALIALESGASL